MSLQWENYTQRCLINYKSPFFPDPVGCKYKPISLYKKIQKEHPTYFYKEPKGSKSRSGRCTGSKVTFSGAHGLWPPLLPIPLAFSISVHIGQNFCPSMVLKPISALKPTHPDVSYKHWRLASHLRCSESSSDPWAKGLPWSRSSDMLQRSTPLAVGASRSRRVWTWQTTQNWSPVSNVQKCYWLMSFWSCEGSLLWGGEVRSCPVVSPFTRTSPPCAAAFLWNKKVGSGGTSHIGYFGRGRGGV